MRSPSNSLVVVGTVFQTPTADVLEVLSDVVIAVASNGLIGAVEPAGSAAAVELLRNADTVVRLGPQQRLLPGLIDLHIHAPQWPQLGTGLDLPLEQWLFEYTFPLEARYVDPGFATRVWNDMVPTLLAHGTTTAVYYATVDEAATLSLADACLTHGQRAFVGRVAMDHPEGTPTWYRDPDPATGIARSRRSLEAIREMAGSERLVQPIVTPRFVPACTDELLAGLGHLAEQTDTLIQTHCSESDWQHDYAIGRFGRRDIEVLDHFGLAREHSILAHGDMLSNSDLDHVARTGAAIAHCPLSNVYFGGAVFPVRRALDRGVRVGLGTDVAGGSSPGLLAQAALAVNASRYLEDGVDNQQSQPQRGVANSRISTMTAFWLATVGGAQSLGIPAGLIRPGNVFDAFVVDLEQPHSALRVWEPFDDDQRVFEKIVRLAGSSEIAKVWVNGRLVSERVASHRHGQ